MKLKETTKKVLVFCHDSLVYILGSIPKNILVSLWKFLVAIYYNRYVRFFIGTFIKVVFYIISFALVAFFTLYVFGCTPKPIVTDVGGRHVVQTHIKTTPLPTEMINNYTNWDNLKPCGAYFNEVKHYERALTCANELWKDDPISSEINIPRCFVISSASMGVVYNGGANLIMVTEFMGAVGYFDTNTDTVFIVENYNVEGIYRHELQHLFLKKKTGYGGGHHQQIWKSCEPPYFETPLVGKVVHELSTKK